VAEPRFLLVSGGSPVRGRTLSRADGASAQETWYAWRLLGSNNRELGRSSAVYADPPACFRSAEALQAGVSRAEPVAAVNQKTGLWVWRLDLEGTPAAVAARSYKRRRECLYSLERFLATAPLARTEGGKVARFRPGRPWPVLPSARAVGADSVLGPGPVTGRAG
jgi:hypothetical protein